MIFEWDVNKEVENIKKHNVPFDVAKNVFADPNRIIRQDKTHSINEDRYIAIGLVDDKILTVRFTIRGMSIRIFGAGYWRKEKAYYEKENNIR